MKFSLIISFFLISAACTVTAESQEFSITYFSENINFNFDKSSLPDYDIRFDEWFVKRFYSKLERSDLNRLASEIVHFQEVYNLNGWLTYGLIEKMINEIAIEKPTNYKRLLIWFLLNKTGYDARLAHYEEAYFVQVYTKDDLYEIPYFEIDNRIFINISAIKGSKSSYQNKSLEFYLIEFRPNPTGKSLSFDLNQIPVFKPIIINQSIQFWIKGRPQKLTVNLDKNIIDLMNNYPIVAENEYVFRELSQTLHSSLITQLRTRIEGMTQKETVQYLLALTRSGFRYKEDIENFGYNRPMIADEVFYYSSSDCEDRSALFFNLAKELLDLPMIIVSYPDHLTIGIKLDINEGKPLYYKGEKYTICDPTGPSNSSDIGIYPKGYERKAYEVIGAYK